MMKMERSEIYLKKIKWIGFCFLNLHSHLLSYGNITIISCALMKGDSWEHRWRRCWVICPYYQLCLFLWGVGEEFMALFIGVKILTDLVYCLSINGHNDMISKIKLSYRDPWPHTYFEILTIHENPSFLYWMDFTFKQTITVLVRNILEHPVYYA